MKYKEEELIIGVETTYFKKDPKVFKIKCSKCKEEYYFKLPQKVFNPEKGYKMDKMLEILDEYEIKKVEDK